MNIFKGRISRRRYNYWVFGWFIVTFLLALIFSLITLTPSSSYYVTNISRDLFLFFYIPLSVRRLHDLGYSAKYLLLLIIPLALPLYLILFGGQKEENKYGAVPS